MKKYQTYIFMLVLSFCIGIMTSLAGAAEVLDFKGKVQMQSASEVGWTPVERGMKLEFGDSIRTARNSFVDIALDNAKLNTIRVEQKAMVVLNSESDGNIDRVDLAKGRIYANLEDLKAGMNFEVSTPSSIAGVRGSSYSVYAERESDEILAIKDTVFLKAFDANKKELMEIMVPEGFKTFVERFGAPSALIQVSTQEFQRFDNIMEDINSAVEGKFDARAKREQRKEREKVQKKEHRLKDKTPVQKVSEQVEQSKEIIDRVKDIQEIIEDRNKIQEIIDSHDDYYSEGYYEQLP